MAVVGIRELKAKLSSYIDRVRDGEPVVITDRGDEVAVIMPISAERRSVKALLATGRARWSGGKPAGLRGIRIKGKPLSRTVLDERR